MIMYYAITVNIAFFIKNFILSDGIAIKIPRL